MRKSTYLLIGTGMALLLGAFFLVGSLNQGKDPRAAYEEFLREEAQVFANLDMDEILDKPKMDRPDLAALSDFFKTVDPELKTVPKWRSIEAYNALKAQPSQLKSGLETLEWTHHPTDMGGRTRTMMFDPNDPNHAKVWTGAVTGGLWVSEDAIGGQPWQPVNDFYSNLSISSLTYDPNNTTTFFAGTGESQTALIIYRESSGRGSGLYRSDDAGATWNLIPSTKDWAYVNDVIVRDEDGQSVVYAAVSSGTYKGQMHTSEPSDGLYRSADNGESWTQVLPLVPSGNRPYAPSDIQLNGDGSRMFVGTTYHWDDREGAASILYSDNGTDWTVIPDYYNLIVDGYSLGNRTYHYPGRVMLSASPNTPGTLYALVAAGYVRSDQFIGYDCAMILKTTDGGQTWEQKSVAMRGGDNTFAYLAWHALAVTVSPYNPNMVWIGGLDVWRTTNGGDSWTKYTDWAEMYGNGASDYVHADIHHVLYKPGSDTDLLIATDGGIFGTRSASAQTPYFFEVNRNFSTLQYYSGAIHPAAGAVHFMGGLQDNGTMFYKANVTPTFTDMLSGGDGALCFIDEDNPKIHLTTVYHNSIYLWNAEKESDPAYVRARSFNSGMFVNAMDYNSRDDILFANRMREEGTYPNQIEVIGITESGINSVNTSRNLKTGIDVPFTVVKYSPHSPSGQSTLYLGSQAGHLFKQEHAAAVGDLTNLTSDDFPTANMSCIQIGQSEDTLLVTFSNYGVASVWWSVDAGQTWQNKEGNLPDIPVRWALIHPENGKQVMLATELGVWTTRDITDDPVVWTQNISGLANVRVDQIKLRKTDLTVLAATHGRGMFTTTWPPVYATGTEDLISLEGFSVFPNPSSGAFSIEMPANRAFTLVISDAAGRVVHKQEVEASQAVWHGTLDLTREPKGLYFVQVITGNQPFVQKVLIQ